MISGSGGTSRTLRSADDKKQMRVLTIHRAPRCPSGRGDKSYGPQFRYPNNRQIGLTTPVIQIPEQLSDGCRFSERRHLGPGHPREEHAAREESVVGLSFGQVVFRRHYSLPKQASHGLNTPPFFGQVPPLLASVPRNPDGARQIHRFACFRVSDFCVCGPCEPVIAPKTRR